MTNVRVVGTPELIRDIRALRARAASALLAASRAGALIIQTEAQVLAPRRSGQMASAFFTQPLERTPTRASQQIGNSIYYFRFQELGTRRSRKQASLGPAFERRWSAAERTMLGIIRRGLRV